jgi:rhamnose utilization protein RhaD (predicted bifunctional aldolase and dehydrogenase)
MAVEHGGTGVAPRGRTRQVQGQSVAFIPYRSPGLELLARSNGPHNARAMREPACSGGT